MKNVMKVAILSLLFIASLWFLGSALFVKAQIINSPDAYIFDKSGNPIVVIVPIEGDLSSTIFNPTYSGKAWEFNTEGTSALFFERSIYPLSKNENIKEFLFLVNSDSDNGPAAEEISRIIKQIPQPTTVIIQGEVGRASYIVASGADTIVMEKDANLVNLGNVGMSIHRTDYGTKERKCETSTKDIHTLTESDCKSFLDEDQIENLREYILDRTKIQQEIMASNRNLPIEKITNLLNRSLSASEALDRGLVDLIGNKEEFLELVYSKIGNFKILNIG